MRGESREGTNLVLAMQGTMSTCSPFCRMRNANSSILFLMPEWLCFPKQEPELIYSLSPPKDHQFGTAPRQKALKENTRL